MNKTQLIKQLSLQPHIEGGYYRRTYQSELLTADHSRHIVSSIFYMLTDDSPVGFLHKNESDILHFFHGGSALHYYLIHPNGRLQRIVLGDRPDLGQQLQFVVKAGCWKATELPEGQYGLISEAVAPGFDYQDMELATESRIKTLFPDLWADIGRFVKRKTAIAAL